MRDWGLGVDWVVLAVRGEMGVNITIMIGHDIGQLRETQHCYCIWHWRRPDEENVIKYH